MFENYNEQELLSLMLNKDEFLQYIAQQYKDSSIPLEPFIWAVHFNIPKNQRLQLLDNILYQCMTYVKTCYSFLPKKQILGKTYELLGIPTVCGQPDKCFLNAYKKYKSYYPVKYPKNRNNFVLNNITHNSVETNLSIDYSEAHSTPLRINKNIISSTPISKYIPSIEINLSPIRTMKERNHDGQQLLSLSMSLDFSGNYNLNISHQQYRDMHSNNSQSHMYFISREHIQTENDYTQSDLNNSDGVWSEMSLEEETKDSSDNTFYSLSPHVNIKQPKLNRASSKIKESHSKSSISESWEKIKKSFSNISFSDIDSTSAISNKSSHLIFNKRQIMYNWNRDAEPQNSQNEGKIIFSDNSESKMSNSMDSDEYNKASLSYSSPLSFSEDDNFFPNSAYDSDQLNQEKSEFMEWSQDRYNGNNYENKSTDYNKLIKESSRSNENENFSMSLSSAVDTSLSSISVSPHKPLKNSRTTLNKMMKNTFRIHNN